eukprot:COSAG06_NODE_502_length_14953_cov_15.585297_16_plen_73_part_00
MWLPLLVCVCVTRRCGTAAGLDTAVRARCASEDQDATVDPNLPHIKAPNTGAPLLPNHSHSHFATARATVID